MAETLLGNMTAEERMFWATVSVVLACLAATDAVVAAAYANDDLRHAL